MVTPLSLHVPAPLHRQGAASSFGHLDLPRAGEVRRVDPSTPEDQMRDLPYALIGVLDKAGQAVGPWDPKLDPEPLKAGLRAMLLKRLFDERMFRAHRQGDHGEADVGDSLAGVTFVVAAQTSVSADPGQGALHDPALWQHHEAAEV